jgi:hypothetical protein
MHPSLRSSLSSSRMRALSSGGISPASGINEAHSSRSCRIRSVRMPQGPLRRFNGRTGEASLRIKVGTSTYATNCELGVDPAAGRAQPGALVRRLVRARRLTNDTRCAAARVTGRTFGRRTRAFVLTHSA